MTPGLPHGTARRWLPGHGRSRSGTRCDNGAGW
jgi:hypothetical protein